MGLDIDREHFEPADYERFTHRLQESLSALRALLDRPDFGVGPASIGAEVELHLVDDAGHPLPVNRAVLVETLDPRVQLELDRFNLEYNTLPVPMCGRPFSALGHQLTAAFDELDRAAALHGGGIVTVGTLPTLRFEDVQSGAMTDLPRYRALAAGIRRLRRSPFRLRIDGPDPISLECDEITFEGANTSLQLHLRVAPGDFARTYNAAQIATPLAVAVSANSPILMGHVLWEETRIALFKQAVDDREIDETEWHLPARVSFGHGWVREGAFELFHESAALFPPLLPVLDDEDPAVSLGNGRVPSLAELRLHNGTVWRWNRAVYDCADGGHLRIEMRALPSGPTVADMKANAAYLIGLTLGLADETEWMIPSLPFELAHRNFYRAAQRGLDARLVWPCADPPSPREAGAIELIRASLDIARRGLVGAGVEGDEADAMLDVIERRVASGQTGARWQREQLARLEERHDRASALHELLRRYQERSRRGEPVHGWTVEEA